MSLDKAPGLDPDLSALLPTTATPTERLYGQAIDDSRAMHDERQAECSRHNKALEALAAQQLAEIQKQDPGFSKEDSLFISMVKLGVETRKQTMTTSTVRDTVMQDVIKDGVWIGYQVYNRIAAELGLTIRSVPTDL